MTEQEWLASTDPQAMLEFVFGNDANTAEGIGGGRVIGTDRKLRLWACACARQVWHRLANERSRRAVEVAERYADGEATSKERGLAFNVADNIGNGVEQYTAYACLRADAAQGARELARTELEHTTFLPQSTILAALLRDILGNPYRPLPEVRAFGGLMRIGWITPTVTQLAQAAYDERPGRKCGGCNGVGKLWENAGGDDYGGWFNCPDCHGTGRIDDGTMDPVRLAVLADALEEAGCTDEALLRHLRGEEPCPRCWGSGKPGYTHRHGTHGPGYYVCLECNNWETGRRGKGWIPLRGPHVRGCWVLDLILGLS